MKAFLDWFNDDGGATDIDEVLKAGLSHLWFVTIHPFDDGNGRIARAIADLALARSEHSSQRFYSMSAQIRQERTEYYETLEHTQKGSLETRRPRWNGSLRASAARSTVRNPPSPRCFKKHASGRLFEMFQ